MNSRDNATCLWGFVSCGWVLMSVKVWAFLEASHAREAFVHHCYLPWEFCNVSWRVNPWHTDFLELDFLGIVFLFFNLSSPSFETFLQLANLVNIGYVYAEVIPSHSIVSAPWRLSWDQSRELSCPEKLNLKSQWVSSTEWARSTATSSGSLNWVPPKCSSQQKAGDSPEHEWWFGAGWQLSSFLQQLSSGSWWWACGIKNHAWKC